MFKALRLHAFLAFFRTKDFLFQNSRVLRALIRDFESGFVKKFRNPCSVDKCFYKLFFSRD